MAGVTVTDEVALQLDVVQAILERLSGTISTLPLGVFERGDDDTRTPAKDHPLYRVLHDRPNGFQTSQEFFQDLGMHLCFWRNFYAKILPGEDYAIGGLEPRHPRLLIKIEQREDGHRYYTFRRTLAGLGQEVLRDDEIWHIRKPRLTDDGLRGMSMVETSFETFSRALAVEQFGSAYFRNGGSGGGVLEHPGTFKDKDAENDFLRSWREGGTGLNRHRDRLLKYGVSYKPFSVANDEAQFLDTLKEMTVKICRLWNMPPNLVGTLDQGIKSNVEQQAIDYVVNCIAPWITAIEQAADRDLVVGDDAGSLFVEFNVDGLLRGDFKTRMQGYAWGRQWGWLSVNDVKRMENQKPIGPQGDVYLQPSNMQDAANPTQGAGNNNNPIDGPDDGQAPGDAEHDA